MESVPPSGGLSGAPHLRLPGAFPVPLHGRPGPAGGGIWTHPDLRGRGLGLVALWEVLKRVGAPGRRLWYLVREENGPSIRLTEKAGFRFHGRGERKSRLGVRALGYFQMDEVRPLSCPDLGRMEASAGAPHAQEPPGSLQ